MIDVLICVGHSRRGDKSGAVSVQGEDEYTFNCKVARRLLDKLEAAGLTAQVLADYPVRGYGAAMKWVGKKAYELGAKCAVELHFNSSDRASASGHEWLYYKTSQRGRALAHRLDEAMALARPDAKRRGVKPLGDPSERGYEFVRSTPCPSVVLEPFFGSNAQECLEFVGHPEALADIYTQALIQYLT